MSATKPKYLITCSKGCIHYERQQRRASLKSVCPKCRQSLFYIKPNE